MDTEPDTETLVNLYLNEYFEKTNDEKDKVKFVTIWRFLCNNPFHFKKLIKRKNIVTYLNTLPDIKHSAQFHSNYLAGWRIKPNLDKTEYTY
jgi:hypothetical protein